MAHSLSKGETASAALLLLGLLVAGFLWFQINDGGRDLGAPAADDPFAAMDAGPLIAGEGLGGEGPQSLPWPAEDAQFSNIGGVGPAPGISARTKVSRGAAGGAPDAREASRRPAEGGSVFSRLDRNSDGRLSPAEFAIYRIEGVRPNQQGRKADDLPPYVPTRALNLAVPEFSRLDRNNDWFVSPAEFKLRQR